MKPIIHHSLNQPILEKIPDKSIDLIVTSPPYNVGKEFETKTNISHYLLEFISPIYEFHRILKDTGNICWQVGNYINTGEVYPLDILFYKIFKDTDFRLRNRIIWRFGHGLHCRVRLSGRYETILWFSKTNDYKFNLDPIRIPSKYPNKKHYKGEKKGQLSGNPLGKNPSDVWEVLQQDWENEIWEIPNVKHNHPEKTKHPCQFPVELAERCILALSDESDTILDPYCGVGSTLIAAFKNNRYSIGIEKEKSYIDIYQQQMEKFQEGKLITRPINKPIHDPKAK